MALAIETMGDRASDTRDRLSRLLAVTAALYSLLALLSAAAAAVGLFGLLGAGVDLAAAEPARLLGLPWSLVVGAPEAGDPVATLILTSSALVLNGLLLLVGSRLVAGRLRPG